MTTTTIQQLDPGALGRATAAVTAMLFAACGLAVALAPDAATAVAGYLFHADVGALMPRSLSPASFAVGLVAWSAGVGMVFTAVAALYNRVARRRG